MRRIGLYSLIAFASLALIGLIAVGMGEAPGQEDGSVESASNPTVAAPPAPETTSEETAEETDEDEPETTEQETTAQEEQEDEPRPEIRDGWRDRAAEERATAEERAAAQERAAEQEASAARTAAPTGTALNLTVPKIGIQNDPVTNSVAEGVLANGAGKLPSTGFPWQAGSNTYIAAHVYGYPGTGSWQQFAGLPNMATGDGIFLTGSDGTTYEYRVTEVLTVAPTDVWVAQPTGETTVSLQTCVGPGWSERLVVRGTLVGTSQA